MCRASHANANAYAEALLHADIHYYADKGGAIIDADTNSEAFITNTAGNNDGFIHIHRHADGSEHNAIDHYTPSGDTFECLDCGTTYDLATGEWRTSAL